MSIVLIATVQPQEGCRDEVISALEDAIVRVHQEDEGCELYALHQSKDALVMIEKWSSSETLEAHGKSPAFVELSSRLAGKVVGRLDVQVLTPHPAGTQQQGQI